MKISFIYIACLCYVLTLTSTEFSQNRVEGKYEVVASSGCANHYNFREIYKLELKTDSTYILEYFYQVNNLQKRGKRGWELRSYKKDYGEWRIEKSDIIGFSDSLKLVIVDNTLELNDVPMNKRKGYFFFRRKKSREQF